MNFSASLLRERRMAGLFWPALGATVLLMLVLNWVGSALVTPAAPFGIVSFELAGEPLTAQRILASWNEAARVRAGFSLGLDYLFMLAYAATFSLGCLWAAGELRAYGWPLAQAGLSVSAGQWLAALFDAVENAALALVLFGTTGAAWPRVAQVCALVKFALLFMGLVYIFLGAASRLAPARR